MKYFVIVLLILAVNFVATLQEEMESLNDSCFQIDNDCPNVNCINNELTYNGADEDPVSSSSSISFFHPYVVMINILMYVMMF